MFSLGSNPLQAIRAGKRNNNTRIWLRAIYARFARCLVRPESEVVSRCFVPVDGSIDESSLLSSHLDSSTSHVLCFTQENLFDNELCCNSIIHPSIESKKSLTWLDSCDSQIFPIEKDLFSTLGRNDSILREKRLRANRTSGETMQVWKMTGPVTGILSIL